MALRSLMQRLSLGVTTTPSSPLANISRVPSPFLSGVSSPLPMLPGLRSPHTLPFNFPSSLCRTFSTTSITPGTGTPGAIAINTISDNPGSKRQAKRLGRGIGSGKGKTAGRGHKGQKARSGGGVPPGFEGGAIPMYRKIRKYGFTNKVFKKEYQVLNLDTLQFFVDVGRINPKEKITIDILRSMGAVGKQKLDGVKLLSRGKDLFQTPLHLEVTKASGAAVLAVEKAGGRVELLAKA